MILVADITDTPSGNEMCSWRPDQNAFSNRHFPYIFTLPQKGYDPIGAIFRFCPRRYRQIQGTAATVCALSSACGPNSLANKGDHAMRLIMNNDQSGLAFLWIQNSNKISNFEKRQKSSLTPAIST